MTPTTKAAVIEALEILAGVAEMNLAPGDWRMIRCNAVIAALRSEPEPTPEPGERDERCEFELWMNTQPESASGKWWCRQIDDGGYSCYESDVMWRAWQARASLPPAPTKGTE
jgi:hypothetical protein